MSSGYIHLPELGSKSWKNPVSTFSALPASGNSVGDARVVEDVNEIYTWDGAAWVVTGGGGGSGTVTSVGLFDGSTAPIYGISNSPITGSGSLTFTLLNESAAKVFAGPVSGSATQPGFRSLVSTDLPTGNLTDSGTDGITISNGSSAVIGSGTSISQHVADASHNGYLSSTDWTAFNSKGSGTVTSVSLTSPGVVYTVSGSPVTGSGTLALNLVNQSANQFFAGPTNGSAVAPTFRAIVSSDLPTGNLTDVGTDGITITSGSNAVIGAGTSISQQKSDASHNGYLSSTDWSTFNSKGSGTVTSVALTSPGVVYTVSGSPVTGSGTLALNLISQSANTFLAGPTSGSAVAPTFRVLVASDLPSGTGTVTSVNASDGTIYNVTGGPITGSGTLVFNLINQSANTAFMGPVSGSATTPTFRTLQVQDYSAFPILAFGNGGDGALSINSGTTTATRDMYYSGITITGTGVLNTACCRIFCSGSLDLSNAPAGAIVSTLGTSPSSGSPAGTGGTAGVQATTVTLGTSSLAGAGGAGTTGTGSQATAGGTGSVGGGASGNGSVGGSGTSAGGAIRNASALIQQPPQRFAVDILRGAALLSGGQGAPGGSGGGGDGSTSGAGGGGGGVGGNVIWISAYVINRGGSTAVGCIQSKGQSGASGGTTSAGNTGGGGGGPGGGGGLVMVSYGSLVGSSASNAIDVTGGNGGQGGNGHGTGLGGDGGGAASGGAVLLCNLTAGTATLTTFSNSQAGAAHSGTTGGSATTATTSQVSL